VTIRKVKGQWYCAPKGRRRNPVNIGIAFEVSTYLRDFFARISAHPHHRLDELLPGKWRFARRNASST
jgi:hypothetical protein